MSKDVDLVIRARGEGLKLFDTVTRSLENVVDTNKDVADSATKAGSVIERLKQQFVALNRDAGNLANVGRIGTNLDKATSAVERLAGSAAKTETELHALTKSATDAANAAARLDGLSAHAASSITAQKAAIAATRAEIAKETAEIGKLETALKRVESLQSKAAIAGSGATRGSAFDARNHAQAQVAAQSKIVAELEAEVAKLKPRVAKPVSQQDELNNRVYAAAANAGANSPVYKNGGLIKDIYKQLPYISKEIVDKTLFSLQQKGHVNLSQFSDPNAYAQYGIGPNDYIKGPNDRWTDRREIAKTNMGLKPYTPVVGTAGGEDYGAKILRQGLEQERAKLAVLTRDAEAAAKAVNAKPLKGANLPNELPGSTARQSAAVFTAGALEDAKGRKSALTERLASETNALKATTEASKAFREVGSEATKQSRTLAASVDTVSASLSREQTQLAAARTELAALQATAASSAGKVGATPESIAAVQRRNAASQAEVKARIDALSEKRQATVAPTDPAVANRAKLEAYREYGKATEEVARLARAMQAAEAPTDEMGAALGRAKAQAALAKQEYLALAEATQRLRNEAGATERASAAAAAQEQASEAAAASSSARRAEDKARNDTLSARRPATVFSTDPAVANRSKLEAYRGYTQAADEVTRLARAMRDAGAPTDEMAAALGRAKAQAALAKQEYLALAEASQRLKTGPTGSFKDFSARSSTPAPVAAVAPDPGIKAAGSEAAATGGAAREGAEGVKSFREALRGIYGDSRESLSLMQRLRGEILSLTASYIGFQAAVQGVSAVVDQFRVLEAAQSRLGAVFAQDTKRVATEIDYLRREANRLGIGFGTLADEYGKFMIAAQSANITSQDSRKIFISVAEAARVNKFSTEQVSGVFLALTQMMSKGKIQAQELRQQLGDRLPGAVNILAQALGYTTAELDKMMEAGELLASSDNLVAFANQMTKMYGSQLAAALVTTTTEMGRFQNNLQSAALEVANGGLIEGFTALLAALNKWFQTDEGREFFLSMGAGAKVLFEGLAALVPYLGTIKTLFGAIVAVKVAQAFIALGGVLKSNITDLLRASVATTEVAVAQRMATASAYTLSAAQMQLRNHLNGAQIALAVTAQTTGVLGGAAVLASNAVGILRTGLMALSTVARAALAAVGGFAGLIVTALTVAAGYWLTSVDSGTEALSNHKAMIDKVVDGYEHAKDKAGNWAEKLKDVSKVELVSQIQKAGEEENKAYRKIKAPEVLQDAGFGALAYGPANQQLTDLVNKFKSGQITISEFKKQVDSIADADPGLSKGLLTDMVKAAENAEAMTENLDKLRAVLKLYLKQELTETEKRLLGLEEALKDTGAEKATKDMKAFADAINELKSGIPALSIQLQKLKADSEALEALRKGVTAAGGDPKMIAEIYGAYDRKLKYNLDEESKGYVKQFGGEKIPLSMVEEIFGKEGYRSQAYPDIGGKPTIGFGSTFVNGRAVQMGDTISKEDAVNQMVKDLSKFTAMVDSATGNAKLGENQRNALTSMVYNTGNTTAGPTAAIFKAIREGQSDEEVAKLIANGVATVNGEPSSALRTRRQREAGLYLRPDDRLNGQDSGATGYERDKTKLDAQRDFDKSIKDDNEKRARDAADQKKLNNATSETAAKREIEIANAIADAQKKAAESGVEISKEQIALIKETTAAKYDQLHINDQAKEAEEKVNALYKLRQQLIEELKVATEQGDATQIAATKSSIEKVNEQTREAIRLAIQYWQAVGGPEADKAIAKLNLMGAQTERNKTQILTAGQANEKLASGMTRAFDTAAQGIGKAIAGTGSWKDAIQGVGLAFLQFAADFLREIAMMIIKQMILNALQASMGGGGGGGGIIASAVNAMVSTGHTGGVVGSGLIGVGNSTRMVNPAWFESAQRFHNGGMPGLAPNEVPAILKKNEEVLTETDPRNMLNGGGKSSGPQMPQSIKSVLVMDPNMIPDAMASSAGEKVVVATIKANKDTIRQILG